MRGLAKFAHEFIHVWFQRLREALPKPEKRYRRMIAIDETKLKLKGRQLYVWAAVDVKTKESWPAESHERGTSFRLRPSSERFWRPA